MQKTPAADTPAETDADISLALMKILFPDVFLGTKIDFQKLRRLLEPENAPAPHLPELFWETKRKTAKTACAPCRKKGFPAPISAALKNGRNVCLEGNVTDALKLLRSTHDEKIRAVFAETPAPSPEKLKKSPDALVRYLDGVYPELLLIRPLMKKNGCLFFFANDALSPYVKTLCDEVFGAENFVAAFVWQKKSTATNTVKAVVNTLTQNILCYQNGRNALSGRVVAAHDRKYPFTDERGNFRLLNIEKNNDGVYERKSMRFPILGHVPSAGKRWRMGFEKARRLEKDGLFILHDGAVRLKVYDFDEPEAVVAPSNLLFEQGTAADGAKQLKELTAKTIAETSKPVALYKTLLNYLANDGETDIILDVFSKTGECAQAVLELNAHEKKQRQFILMQKCESSLTKGYDSVAAVAAERVRKTIEKLRNENPDAAPHADSVDFFKIHT